MTLGDIKPAEIISRLQPLDLSRDDVRGVIKRVADALYVGDLNKSYELAIALLYLGAAIADDLDREQQTEARSVNELG